MQPMNFGAGAGQIVSCRSEAGLGKSASRSICEKTVGQRHSMVGRTLSGLPKTRAIHRSSSSCETLLSLSQSDAPALGGSGSGPGASLGRRPVWTRFSRSSRICFGIESNRARILAANRSAKPKSSSS